MTIQAQILDLLRNLKDKINSSIMLITHDLGVIAEMADYVVVMYAGTRGGVQGTRPGDLRQSRSPLHHRPDGLPKPMVGKKVDKLYSIPGKVARPACNMPKGCHFAARCEHALWKAARVRCPAHDPACPPPIWSRCYRYYENRRTPMKRRKSRSR